MSVQTIELIAVVTGEIKIEKGDPGPVGPAGPQTSVGQVDGGNATSIYGGTFLVNGGNASTVF